MSAPPDRVFVLCEPRPLLVVDQADCLGVLVKIIDGEQVAGILVGPCGEQARLASLRTLVRRRAGSMRDCAVGPAVVGFATLS